MTGYVVVDLLFQVKMPSSKEIVEVDEVEDLSQLQCVCNTHTHTQRESDFQIFHHIFYLFQGGL